MPGRKLKRIQKEQHQKGVSVRSIAIQHVVSVRLHNKKQHVYLWLKSLASVDLDSAATISDHDTTGLLECSAVCCSNEMEAYQPKQKAIFQQISKNGRYFTCS